MTAWRAPAGCEAGNCIEVDELPDPGRHIGLRVPTTDGGWQVIVATRAEFAAFIAACKAGQYDDLTREDHPCLPLIAIGNGGDDGIAIRCGNCGTSDYLEEATLADLGEWIDRHCAQGGDHA